LVPLVIDNYVFASKIDLLWNLIFSAQILEIFFLHTPDLWVMSQFWCLEYGGRS